MTPVALLDAAGYEVMPLRGAEDAVCAHVPLGVPLSITMTATKGLEATLARISATLGLGPSARYLLKQNSMLLRFFLPGGYRPDRLLAGLGRRTGITGYHFFTFNFFTFNEVARTEEWRQACLQRLADRRGGHPG